MSEKPHATCAPSNFNSITFHSAEFME